MISYKEEYQRLLTLRQQMKLGDIFQQYKNLSLQTNRTSKEEKQLLKLRQSKEMGKLFLIQRNIKQIEHPIDASFFQKIAYIQKKNVNPLQLKRSKDFLFPDGSSIFLWFSALVDFYIRNDDIEDKTLNVLIQFYKQCVDYSSFSGKLQYLQFLLKLPSREDLCYFLGIMPYLYPKLLCFNCDIKVIQGIIKNLDEKDISRYSIFQQEEIMSFLVWLKKKVNSMPSKIESRSNERKQNRTTKDNSQHLEELLTYLETHFVSSIPKDAEFQDGQNMFVWFDNFSKKALSEENRQSVYKIAKALYNDTTLPFDEGISYNYGASLQRVILVYNLKRKQLFEKLPIPYSLLLPILQNKKFPNPDFIEKILTFLVNLRCETMYQKEFVEEAIAIYTTLKNIPIKGEAYDYTVYPANLEEEYLESITDVDASLLKKVKEQNYDWYMKCITLFFIYNVKVRTPFTNEYFYDGSLVFKWFLTQKKTSNALKFSNEQTTLVAVLNNRFSELSTKMPAFLIYHCDEILDIFEEKIQTYEDLRATELYKTHSLKTLWTEFKHFLKRKDPPFSLEQIKRYKKLRYRVIYNEKMKGMGQYKSKDSLNFGYELACLADSLSISVEKLGNLLKIKPSSLCVYSNNQQIPRLENLAKMLEIITALDVSIYREDQLEDIQHFKAVLKDLIAYRKLDFFTYQLYYQEIQKENGVFSITGEISSDIPVEMLDAICKEDSSWFMQYKEIYSALKEYEDASYDYGQRLTSFSWFKIETYKVMKGETSSLKQYLLCYLFYLNQKLSIENRSTSFINSFLVFETFVYENERLPMKNEIILDERKDGTAFYQTLTAIYFNASRDYMPFLSAEKHERIKNCMQYIVFLQRKAMTDYEEDYQNETGIYLGERIDYVRIALGLRKSAFSQKLGWQYEEFDAVLRNRVALSEAQITSLLSFLEGQEGLREDQIRDITELRTILLKRKIGEGQTFHLFKKEQK